MAGQPSLIPLKKIHWLNGAESILQGAHKTLSSFPANKHFNALLFKALLRKAAIPITIVCQTYRFGWTLHFNTFTTHDCLHLLQLNEQTNKSRNNSSLSEGCEGAILSIHGDTAGLFGHTPVINAISATSLLGYLCFPKGKTNPTENQAGELRLAQCHRHWCDLDPGG